MKHPSLLDDLPQPPLLRREPNIGGLVGVGFCGGGGSSMGIEDAGLRVDFAMNHDAAAIAMHMANCPQALHFRADIWHVRPSTVLPGRPIRFMWFSPDCKHFSKAKGGKPVEKKIRDLAWIIVLWIKERRPDVIVMENVVEFETWGPLDADGKPIKERQGEYFRAFCKEIRKQGYDLGFKKIASYKHGDPTTRERLFGQFRCDGEPISWPEDVYGKPDDPRVKSGELLPWRTAAEHVIDWSQPTYSIFLTREEVRARKLRINRPLVDATFGRITLGLQRFVLQAAKPYIVPITHRTWANRVWAADEPSRAQTCSNGGEHALAVPSIAPVTAEAAHIVKFRADNAGAPAEVPAPAMTANSFELRPGCAAPVGVAESSMIKVANYIASVGGAEYGGRPRPADKPINVMTEDNRQCMVAAHIIQNNGGEIGHAADDATSTVLSKVGHQAVATSYLAHFRGSGPRFGNDTREPTKALTAGGTHIAEVRTFLVKYYSSAEHGQSTGEPVHAQTTKPRFGLVEVAISDTGLTEEQRYCAYWVARLIDVYGHPDGLPNLKARRARKTAVRHRSLLENLEAIHRERPSAVGRDGWLVWDIGMRMFTVRERFRAQGVGENFVIDVEVDGKPITETKQGEMCGNMVTRGTAEAIVRAALPELRQPAAEVAAA